MRAIAVFAALMCAACDGGSGTDGGTDAALRDAAMPDAAPADVEGTGEWTLLLRQGIVPALPPASSREVAGMNLDFHDTLGTSDPIGCFVEDWVAPARYVDVLGIDNQVPNVLTALEGFNPGLSLNDDIEQAIHDLDFLLVMRIRRIGHPTDDGGVDVALFTTEIVGTPVYEMVDVGGRMVEMLAPGQTFRPLPDSLIDGRPRTQMIGASLRGGRLFTPESSFSLRVPASDMRMVYLELNGMRLGGRVSESIISDGLIAGHIRVDDVPATLESLMLMDPPDMSTIETIAQTLADLDTNGDGDCEAISIGIQIEGVAATLVDP